MFSEEDHKIQNNNISSVITEKFHTSADQEFDVKEIKIQCGVLENQLLEENIENPSITKLRILGGDCLEDYQKTEPTNFILSQENVKIEYDEDQNKINKKNYEFYTTSDYKLSNIKCEFNEEQVLENQSFERDIDKSSADITKLQTLNGESSSGTFQETKPMLSYLFSEKGIKIEYDEFKSESNEKNHEFNTSLDHEFSNIKCEFDEEDIKIQYGVLGNELHKEKYTIDVSSLETLDDESACSQKTEPTILFNNKSHIREVINKSFRGKRSLNKHLRILKAEKSFAEKKSYICEECNKCFGKKHILNNHIRIVHTGDEPFKCETCNKCFIDKGRLNKHVKIHTGKKPFKCDTCNKCFVEKWKLKDHIRTHTGKNLFKCETCSKSFIDRGKLNDHIRIHTGEKHVKCETCNKCFIHRGNLNKHMRIHTGDKPFKCETCNKCFIERTKLNVHIRIHTGDEPFKCKTCNKCFIDRGNLNKHMKIHTGEKPFKCETCNKCFIEKGKLAEHNRTHTGEKPYICDICGQGFTQKRYLNTHMRTVHKRKDF